MPRVIHFEIHAENPERGVKFYEQVLGWTFHKWEGPAEYWLITTGPDSEPGINGALMPRRGPIEGDSVIAYVCTVDVESVDATIEAASAAGGSIAHPKMPVPGVGYLAYLKDTEGNIFGAMQADTGAQ